MKILLILTAAFDQGGTQNDMIQLSSALKPLGYDIHLAAPYGTMVDQLEDIGVNFHPIPSPIGGARALLSYTKSLALVVRSHNFEILAPQSIRASLAVGLLRLGRLTRQPVVTSLHNLHDPGNAALASRILNRCCDTVTFENQYERRLMGLEKTWTGRSTSVVYSGVDLNRFRPRRSVSPGSTIAPGLTAPAGKLIGCVARLSPEKDHQTLLKAWNLHIRDHKNDQLVLIGDGPCRSEIERSIALLELGASVTLLGERQDVESILPHFNLFVLSSSRESYPRSAREALACGVPVVLPAIGGCAEIVGSSAAGSLFRSGDFRELAQLLSAQATNRDVSEHRDVARRHAETNFPLKKWRDTMDNLYRRHGNQGHQIGIEAA